MTLPVLQANAEDRELIFQIAKRAYDLGAKFGSRVNLLTMELDITAVHLVSCPLDLKGLLEADDSNFSHDVFGIRKHIDRNTGQLEDYFVPRYSK